MPVGCEIGEGFEPSLFSGPFYVREGQYFMIRPAPKVCPECGKVTNFVLNPADNEWNLDGEWWIDPEIDPTTENLEDLETIGYTCSKKCYLSRKG